MNQQYWFCKLARFRSVKLTVLLFASVTMVFLFDRDLQAEEIELFTAAELLHSFAGDPEQAYNYGDSGRKFFSGLSFSTRAAADSTLLFALDARVTAILGQSEMKHPAMPGSRENRFVETRRASVLSPGSEGRVIGGNGKREASSDPLVVRTGEIFAGLRQRIPDVLGGLGESSNPSIALILGRNYWRNGFQEELSAKTGHFPGLHLIWNSDGFGRAIISPAYLLDAPVSGEPRLGYSGANQSSTLTRGALDSNRYGSSAFYLIGKKWHFGMGLRRHSIRRNARLYQPGILHYVHVFSGYKGKNLRIGLGYSRVTGKVQISRKTRTEKTQDEFQPVARKGGPRKEQSLLADAAEAHGLIRWKAKHWTIGLSFFLPATNRIDEEETHVGYIHPGARPYSFELTNYYGISSGFKLCSDEETCSDIARTSESLYARMKLRLQFTWNNYSATFLMLYSSARTQTGSGINHSSPDPETPDYLEYQLRISRSWTFLRRGSLSVRYGRIYIRKTRASRAFAEFFRMGLTMALQKSESGKGS